MLEVQEENRTEQIRKKFLVEFNEKDYIAPLDRICMKTPKSHSSLAAAFRHNLVAVLSITGMPDRFAIGTAQQLRFRHILMAERIRRIPIEPTVGKEDTSLTQESEEEALKAAQEKFKKELENKGNLVYLRNSSADFLFDSLSSDLVNLAASELLRQATVLTWSALEVLSRGLLISTINANPKFAISLTKDPRTKGKFRLKSIDFEALEQYAFDLSIHMGDLLSQFQDFSNLGVIKDIYRVLFPDSESLHNSLNKKDLWVLNQRRHLILHKRGVVDNKYVHATSDTTPIGSVLEVSPEEIKVYLKLVRDVGIELLCTAESM